MQRVQNVSLQEILSMERSIPGCLLIIDAIRDLAENDLEDLETKKNEMLLFQKLLETYPELPFYKFIEMFSLVGDHLKDDDYQQLVTFAFQRQGNLDIRGKRTKQ